MRTQAEIEKDFLLPDLKEDGARNYLQKIRNVTSKHSGSEITLKMVEKYSFKVGSLAGSDMLKEWEQFYLPDYRKMEVIGVLEEFPCNSPNDELVLMVCEDGNIFGYEGNRLHLISDDLKELFERGLQFPGTKQYYRGQRFEVLTDDEWNRVKKTEKVKERNKKHQEMLDGMAESILKNLDIIKQRQKTELWSNTEVCSQWKNTAKVTLKKEDMEGKMNLYKHKLLPTHQGNCEPTNKQCKTHYECKSRRTRGSLTRSRPIKIKLRPGSPEHFSRESYNLRSRGLWQGRMSMTPSRPAGDVAPHHSSILLRNFS